MTRPLLIVGDVQGDVERLEEALLPYPQDEVDTVFLGDFFQGGRPGRGGGAAAARLARSRDNSRAVLGNHDLFLLAVLERRRGVEPPPAWQARDPEALEALWLHRRGDWADLEAVQRDPGLELWLRELPFLLLRADGTLVQHTDDDLYATLGDTVERSTGTRTSGWRRRRGLHCGAHAVRPACVRGAPPPRRLPGALRCAPAGARAHASLGGRAERRP